MEFTLVTTETNRMCLSLKSQNKNEAMLLKCLQGAKLEVWVRDDQNSELQAEAYLEKTTSPTTLTTNQQLVSVLAAIAR